VETVEAPKLPTYRYPEKDAAIRRLKDKLATLKKDANLLIGLGELMRFEQDLVPPVAAKPAPTAPNDARRETDKREEAILKAIHSLEKLDSDALVITSTCYDPRTGVCAHKAEHTLVHEA